MDDLFCEVIGCFNCAAWRRVGGKKQEDYLCGMHRQWFIAMHPNQADSYLPLEESDAPAPNGETQAPTPCVTAAISLR